MTPTRSSPIPIGKSTIIFILFYLFVSQSNKKVEKERNKDIKHIRMRKFYIKERFKSNKTVESGNSKNKCMFDFYF